MIRYNVDNSMINSINNNNKKLKKQTDYRILVSKHSLPYSWVKIYLQTKFHQNWLKNVEVRKFLYKMILVGQAGR